MNIEPTELTARVAFAIALRARWPSKELIAEARLEGEPWSIKLRLWSPPDETGTCMASASFLVPSAPYIPGTPLQLTLGPTVVGICTLTPKPIRHASLGMELDFLDTASSHPVRTAA